MAIIPRYTSRALPPGAQPGLIESAQKRGRAGAGLASALGGAIVAGVDYKKRKDEKEAAEEAYWTQTIKEMSETNKGLGDSLKENKPFGETPLPDGWTVEFGGPAPAGNSGAGTAAGAGDNLSTQTDLQRKNSQYLNSHSNETGLAKAEAAFSRLRALAVSAAKTGGFPAKGMASRMLAEFDRMAGKLAESVKDDPELKARFDAMAESNRAPLELRVLQLENQRRAGEEREALAGSLDTLALTVMDDPAMAPGVAGRGLAQIESAMKVGILAPEEAAGMQGDFADRVHMSAMRGQIATDPEGVQTRLLAGEFDDVFEPGARDLLVGEASTAARVKAAGASAAARARRRGLEGDMAAHLEALNETGAGDEALDARARAELPDFQYAAFQQGQRQARERHATRAEYAFMTAEEIEADIAAQVPGEILSDSDERDAAHVIRAEIRDEVLAARAADPAGWAMRDGDVAASFAAAQENPADPVLASRAHAMRLALQREMGIEQPRLLSDAERDEIAGELAQATPADRPAIIAALRGRYGAQAGMLAAELAGEVDANTALLLAHADMPHLPRLLAQGMAKSAKDGPAPLSLTRPEALGDLPALPITDKGEHGGRRLDMGGLKTGMYYRAADGGVLLYDGEALLPMAVEIAIPDPADPNAPTLPLPLGKANPLGEVAVKGIAYERDEQGNPVAVDVDGEGVDDIGPVDLEEADPRLPSGLEDDDRGLDSGAAEDGEPGDAANPQARKRRNLEVWLGWAGFGGDALPGWKELPRSGDGRIDRGALEDDQVYHVVGTDGRRSAWRWNEGKRTFVPHGRWVDAFSIDGMHELIGVPVRRTPEGRPIYNMEQDRVNAIKWGVDAVFEIADNTKDKGGPTLLAIDAIGRDAVNSHNEIIEKVGKELNVEPDLIRAIIFVENSHGYYGVPLEIIDENITNLTGLDPSISDTILPMNINPDTWSALGITRETARDPEANIRAGAKLIGEIWNRLENPTSRKVAALWQFIGAEHTDNAEIRNFVARVGRAAIDKPWAAEVQPETK